MKIIAHRGASGEFPENSILAFEQAINQQADAIELDAHFHQSSGHYIVVHDHLVMTESGQRMSIQECSIEQLLHHSFVKQLWITSLQDALRAIAGQKPINIELKSFTGNKQAINDELNALKATLKEYQANFQVDCSDIVISSFNHHLLRQSYKIMPAYKYGALIAHIPVNITDILGGLAVDYLNVDVSAVNAELVQSAKRADVKVQVYTVDDYYDIQRCLQYGVDAIFTNWPAKTRRLISTLNKELLSI